MSGANATIRIGELGSRTGTSVRSLRYYEQQGLLSSERTSSGQRVYRADDADRVRYIRQLIDAGLGTRTIREIIPCFDQHVADAGMVDVLIAERDRVAAQVESLLATQKALDRYIEVAWEHMAERSA